MKRFIYTILMTAIVATTLVGCDAQVDAIKTIPTKESYVDGDQDWYVEITDDDSYITAVEVSPQIYNPAITVTLRLAEEVNLPENMTPEYKDIYLCMFGSDKIGHMEPTDESRKALTKLLSGDAGDEAEITFVSPEALSMMEIEKDVESAYNFSLDNLDFAVDGKIHKNEFFKCIFDGEDQDIVIEQFLELADSLEEAYDAYTDDESTKGYDKLKELYREAEIFAKKLDASLDVDDVTMSQYERIEESVETINEMFYEI